MILNLRFINNSLLPIPVALRTECTIKKKTYILTLNLYSPKNLSKETQMGRRSGQKYQHLSPWSRRATTNWSLLLQENWGEGYYYLYPNRPIINRLESPTLQGILSVISWRSGMVCLTLSGWLPLRSTSRNYIYTT